VPIRCRLTKVANAPAVLTLVRSNGTRTTARIGDCGGDGPVHELAQFVVERALGLTCGYLGLLGAGWTAREFDTPVAVRQSETDVVLAECVARQLSRDARAADPQGLEIFNAKIAWAARRMHPDFEPLPLTGAQLSAMRMELQELRARWMTLPIGGTLELSFAREGVAGA
jgi:hypothetical protein